MVGTVVVAPSLLAGPQGCLAIFYLIVNFIFPPLLRLASSMMSLNRRHIFDFSSSLMDFEGTLIDFSLLNLNLSSSRLHGFVDAGPLAVLLVFLSDLHLTSCIAKSQTSQIITPSPSINHGP